MTAVSSRVSRSALLYRTCGGQHYPGRMESSQESYTVKAHRRRASQTSHENPCPFLSRQPCYAALQHRLVGKARHWAYISSLVCRNDGAIFTGETGDGISRLTSIRIKNYRSRTRILPCLLYRSNATQIKQAPNTVICKVQKSSFPQAPRTARRSDSPHHAFHNNMGAAHAVNFGKCSLCDVRRRVSCK